MPPSHEPNLYLTPNLVLITFACFPAILVRTNSIPMAADVTSSVLVEVILHQSQSCFHWCALQAYWCGSWSGLPHEDPPGQVSWCRHGEEVEWDGDGQEMMMGWRGRKIRPAREWFGSSGSCQTPIPFPGLIPKEASSSQKSPLDAAVAVPAQLHCHVGFR